MDKRILSVLQKTPLFHDIEENDVENLLSCIGARSEKVKKNTYILLAGEEIESLGVVLSGSVEVSREDAAGRRVILAVFGAGNLFAESLVCARVEKSPVSVRAAADCEILMLKFLKVMGGCANACTFHRLLIRNMLEITARKNLLLNRKIEYLMMKGMREKLTSYLLEQAAKDKKAQFVIPLNRSELSEFLNVDRSALSRELGRMREEGLIDFYKDEFTIHDFAKLSSYLPQ